MSAKRGSYRNGNIGESGVARNINSWQLSCSRGAIRNIGSYLYATVIAAKAGGWREYIGGGAENVADSNENIIICLAAAENIWNYLQLSK